LNFLSGAHNTGAVNSAVYWSKVGLELGKHIWVKEGLSPPSIAQFQTTYQQILQNAIKSGKKYVSDTKAMSDLAGSITKSDVIKGGAYAVQFFGLFALGEMIGRRNIYGYPKYETHAHH
jgi:F-type H+-transporting ATPase subunit g